MKPLFLLLFCAAAAYCQEYATVIAVQANLREGPASSAQSVGVVKRNARVRLLLNAHRSGWYWVASGKVKGWIYGNSIKIDEFENLLRQVRKERLPSLDKYALKRKDYSSVYEDEWLLYEATTDDYEYYNPSKMTRIGRLVSIWTKSKNKITDKTTQTSLLQIDCGNSRSRSLAGVKYYASGAVEHTWDRPSAAWSVIIPDTIAEAIMIRVCKDAI